MGTNQRGWPSRVLVRYVLLQLPGVILLVLFVMLIRRWFDIPAWLVWGFLGLWVAKDVILYPLVRRSYDPNEPAHENPMLGARGIAEDRLAPSGYMSVHGELWQAEVMEGSRPVEKGEGVVVRAAHGLRLIVEPDNGQAGPQAERKQKPRN